MAKASKLQNFLLYLFFFSLNFEIWDPLNTNGNFSVAKFTGFLYAFSLIPKLQYFFTTHKSIIIYARMLLILYVFICIMNFINMNYFSSDFLFFSFFQNILLFLLVISHERLSPGVLEKGFIVFFFGSLVLAACFYLGIGLEVNIEGRVSLFGDNENIIGVRMVVSALMLTHILLKYRNKVSKFIYTILPLAYIPLVTLTLNTGSRLSFISLFLGISVIFILYKNRGTFSKILILGIGVIAAVFLFEIAMESEVLGARLAKTGEEGNLAGRDNIWLAILPLIENNWILGVGRTGYIEYYIHYLEK
ncbi:MAG: O-antigen ligase family protein [Moheibacter sp.]